MVWQKECFLDQMYQRSVACGFSLPSKGNQPLFYLIYNVTQDHLISLIVSEASSLYSRQAGVDQAGGALPI